MKIICAPSHVMRDGSDLNQQGQGAWQEHASSNSPATFQEGFRSLLPVSAAVRELTPTQALRTATMIVCRMFVFIRQSFRFANQARQPVGILQTEKSLPGKFYVVCVMRDA